MSTPPLFTNRYLPCLIDFGQNSDKMTDNFIQGALFFIKLDKGDQTAIVEEYTIYEVRIAVKTNLKFDAKVKLIN